MSVPRDPVFAPMGGKNYPLLPSIG